MQVSMAFNKYFLLVLATWLRILYYTLMDPGGNTLISQYVLQVSIEKGK